VHTNEADAIMPFNDVPPNQSGAKTKIDLDWLCGWIGTALVHG
jgi:hypothetical protein